MRFALRNLKNAKHKELLLSGAFFLGIFLLYSWAFLKIDPGRAVYSDALVKWIQAKSIAQAGKIAAPRLVYPARDMDPEYRFFPFRDYLVVNRGIKLSPFPPALSLLAAPFASSPAILVGSSALSIFLLLLLLRFSFRFSNFTLILAALGLPLILFALEFNEHPLLLLFSALGLLYFIRPNIDSGENDNKRKAIGFLSGLLLGSGVWLRHEALIFLACLGLAAFWAFYSFRLRDFLKGELFFLGGASIAVLSFFAFNYANYDHILGPRYLYNYSGGISSLFSAGKFRQALSLLFASKFKLGLFGYTPLFLFILGAFLFSARARRTLQTTGRFFLLLLVPFLILTSLAAPNDGVVNWGSRYLSLALIPFLFLTDAFYREFIRGKKVWALILFSLPLLFSIYVSRLGVKIATRAARQQKALRAEFNRPAADFLVFQNKIFIGALGPDYFRRRALLAAGPAEARVLIARLKKRIKSGDGKANRTALILHKITPAVAFFIQEEKRKRAKSGAGQPSALERELLLNDDVRRVFDESLRRVSRQEGKKTTIYIYEHP